MESPFVTTPSEPLEVDPKDQIRELQRQLAEAREINRNLTAVVNELGGLYASGTLRNEKLGQTHLAARELAIDAIKEVIRGQHEVNKSKKDPLTGLYTKEGFIEQFETLTLNRRFDDNNLERSCLLVGDIDHFKAINDSIGHPRADKEILKPVGVIIGQTIRNTDIAGRPHGDEFFIVLNGTEADRAIEVTKKLRESLTENGIDIGMSFGIAEFTHGEAFEDVNKRADYALMNPEYGAKISGKNTSIIWNPESH